MSGSRGRASWGFVLGLLALPCCASRAIPDPRAAAAAYARAAAAGDADAIYAMLTSAAQRTLSAEDARRVVKEEHAELAEQAAGLASKDTRVEARARLRFGDGEEVALDLSEGRFFVSGAGTLPGGAATPAGALDELRRVVARRSYGGLVRILTPSARTAMEQDLRGLVTGLERPDTLEVVTHGDEASAIVPGGHHVKLKREGGLWRVEDFD
jgi:hypothetical protein